MGAASPSASAGAARGGSAKKETQMSIPTKEPPDGTKRVRWEVQIPGKVTWTLQVESFTKEEAIAVACNRLENEDLKPDDEPEAELSDAEIVAWEDLDDEGNIVVGDPLPTVETAGE